MEPVVDIARAAERIRQSLESSALWAAALAGSAVRPPPLAVRPLARRISPYYLVEIVRDTAVTARFAIDHDGMLLEAEGVKETGARLSPWIGSPGNESGIAAPLVWKPCDQSATRLQPFFEVDRIAGVAFTRVDGANYAHLTVPIGRG